MKPRFAASLVLILLALLSWLFIDYFMLPAYNVQSSTTWVLAAVYLGIVALALGLTKGLRSGLGAGVIVAAALLAVRLVAGLGNALILPGNDGRFYRLLPVTERTEADFSKDFSAAKNPLILPVLDKDLSYKIAQGKMGTYGAQFKVLYDQFTQLTVRRNGKDELVRVGPLDYASDLIALTRGSRGTAGYIEVNVVTEQARLVEVEGGLKYTPGAVFGYDLERKARFAARGSLLGPYTFEIDDAGHPWWVFPLLTHKVGLFGGEDAKGVLLLDGVSGTVQRYASGQEPDWVERAIPTDMVMAQANDYLSLKNGWVNRQWGEKKDVFQISDGYNYEATSSEDSGRTWFVSGITSPSETDQTSVGILMVDLRTKAALRYPISGITEMRAMQIAQSDERVRAQNLTATWPMVTSVDGSLAYFMILKNEVQRQKFVFVDVSSGARVAMGDTIDQARVQFAGLSGGAAPSAAAAAGTAPSRLTVLRVREDASTSSVTFMAKGDPATLYVAPASLGNGVRFLSAGDEVSLRYRDSESTKGQRFVQELRNLSIGEPALAAPSPAAAPSPSPAR